MTDQTSYNYLKLFSFKGGRGGVGVGEERGERRRRIRRRKRRSIRRRKRRIGVGGVGVGGIGVGGVGVVVGRGGEGGRGL